MLYKIKKIVFNSLSSVGLAFCEIDVWQEGGQSLTRVWPALWWIWQWRLRALCIGNMILCCFLSSIVLTVSSRNPSYLQYFAGQSLTPEMAHCLWLWVSSQPSPQASCLSNNYMFLHPPARPRRWRSLSRLVWAGRRGRPGRPPGHSRDRGASRCGRGGRRGSHKESLPPSHFSQGTDWKLNKNIRYVYWSTPMCYLINWATTTSHSFSSIF